jgi:CspA family cold shock protein
MQGVVKAFDPASGDYELAPNALEGSLFRMLRQGQRVVFQLNDKQQATKLSLGSESDMGTPGY